MYMKLGGFGIWVLLGFFLGTLEGRIAIAADKASPPIYPEVAEVAKSALLLKQPLDVDQPEHTISRFYKEEVEQLGELFAKALSLEEAQAFRDLALTYRKRPPLELSGDELFQMRELYFKALLRTEHYILKNTTQWNQMRVAAVTIFATLTVLSRFVTGGVPFEAWVVSLPPLLYLAKQLGPTLFWEQVATVSLFLGYTQIYQYAEMKVALQHEDKIKVPQVRRLRQRYFKRLKKEVLKNAFLSESLKSKIQKLNPAGLESLLQKTIGMNKTYCEAALTSWKHYDALAKEKNTHIHEVIKAAEAEISQKIAAMPTVDAYWQAAEAEALAEKEAESLSAAVKASDPQHLK